MISTSAAGRAHSAHRGLMLNRVRPPSSFIKRCQKLMRATYPTTEQSAEIALRFRRLGSARCRRCRQRLTYRGGPRRRPGALVPAACRLSRRCASGSDLPEARREPAFEGFFPAVTRPQWLEQAMVGCPYNPRQRELMAPTEAVVGQFGVRNRRVSVQSVMNERSGERYALSAALADRRSVLCGCPTRSRTGRAVHRSRRRSSGWGTGSLVMFHSARRSTMASRHREQFRG